MILQWIKKLWEILNSLTPQTRTLIIILLFGYILYFQITDATKEFIIQHFQEEIIHNKKAEQYSMETSIELNHQVQLIAEKDEDAFDVLLLNYHNNTQSLQGYKYLYLSCLTEAPRSLDTPLLKQQWNKIDYIYYADELSRIHQQSFVQIEDIQKMGNTLPKLYHLAKASDAKAISFFTIEGSNSAIGMVVILYREPKSYDSNYYRSILPCIQRLAILLDYENIKNDNYNRDSSLEKYSR